MKRINIILGIVSILGGLISCDEEKIASYSGEEGIYFNKQSVSEGQLGMVDSTNFTFAYVEEVQDSQLLQIPVQLVGRVVDYPRPVNIKVDGGDAVEGVDYQLLLNQVLPAGADAFNFQVILKRTEALLVQEKTFTLSIEENEYFKPVVTKLTTTTDVNILRHKIIFSELFTTPPVGWKSYVIGFTRDRFFLLCDKMKVGRDEFNDSELMTESRFQYLVSKIQSYTLEQVFLMEHGQPYDKDVFDENGEPIFETEG